MSAPIVVLSVVVVAGPSLWGVIRTQGGAFRHNLDFFNQLMLSPLNLVLPVVAALLGTSALYQQLGDRFAVNTRTRVAATRYVGAKLVVAFALPGAVLAGSVLVAFLTAFVLWPAIGNPGINPELYRMSPAEAARDALVSTSYSQLLVLGDGAYGVLYAAWVGVGAGLYGGAAVAALLIVKNRTLALSSPFVLYVGQTIGAALLGAPQLGLMYSLFPVGLSQSPIAVAASPQLALAFLLLVVWGCLWPRLRYLHNLS